MKVFWPSEEMHAAAKALAVEKGMDWTSRVVWKALRRHFQQRIDKGTFKGITSRELAKNHGVDVDTWDGGDGTFDAEDLPGMDKVVITAPAEYDEGDLPPPTGRTWLGERWDGNSWLTQLPGARNDYFAWYNEMILNEDNFGTGTIPLGQIHEEWCLLVDHPDQNRDMFLCSRDHYKSSIFHVGYYTYLICEKQDKVGPRGIFSLAWDENLSMETFDAVKRNLSENQRILSFYGYLIDDERSSTQRKMFFTFQPKANRYPGLFCAPISGGRITGTHAYLYGLDDIMDKELTPRMASRLQTIFNVKLYPAMGPGSRMIVTGTIKGYTPANDIYLWLEQNPAFTTYRYPAANAMPPAKDIIYERYAEPIINPLTGRPRVKHDGTPLTRNRFRVTEILHREKYRTLYPERYSIEKLAEKFLEYQQSLNGVDKFFSEYFLIASNPTGRFFDTGRMLKISKSRFFTAQDVVSCCRDSHYPIYLWIDPGGQGGHGIAVVVMTRIGDESFLLDAMTIRKPVIEAALDIVNLIVKYNVSVWGCEGNFAQKDTHGYTIEKVVHQRLISMGRRSLVTPCRIRNNTGEKLNRIATHFSALLGANDQQTQFFYNPEADDVGNFKMQARRFGSENDGSQKHDYDLLDCCASIRIHLLDISVSASILVA